MYFAIFWYFFKEEKNMKIVQTNWLIDCIFSKRILNDLSMLAIQSEWYGDIVFREIMFWTIVRVLFIRIQQSCT